MSQFLNLMRGVQHFRDTKENVTINESKILHE